MEQEPKKQATGIRTAYSAEGFLVDQARITDVRYGCRTSDRNGCGWIAVYNLLRCLNDDADYSEIVAALARHSLFCGLFGTSPFRIRRYLKRRGHDTLTVFGKGRTAEIGECARAGILMYRHSGGWHFVAFAQAGDGVLRFYNAVAGQACERTMERFLAEQNRAPIVWALYIPHNGF